MRRTAITFVSLGLTAAMIAATPAVAEEAAAVKRPKLIAKGQVSPLSLAVTPGGKVWYSQNFAGLLMRARPGRPARPVYKARGQGTELGAVSVRRGVVTFATTGGKGRTGLWTRGPKGKVTKVANLSFHEKRHNPDGGATYGALGLTPECEAEWPQDQLGPASYTGIVESHPYASLTRRGTTYVADAAANAILGVSKGVVSTVSVLPPQVITIPAEAAAMGIPECAVGHEYAFEPVPTDVEMGKDGMLYVSTLPGGPEDASFGNRAAVHRVDPATGDVETVATGLLSATGLAIGGKGAIYVAELFRNRIAVIPAGSDQPRRWAHAKMPGDLEFARGRLWGTRKVLAKGQVVRY